MAKLVKHVKLGEKALSFSCPTSGVTLIPGVVRELNAKELSSKKVKMAIKGGHLEVVNEEAYKKYQKSLTKSVDEDDETEFYTEKDLKGKNKETLINIIREIDPDNEDNLEKMDKATLVETILLLQEDEDEDEDEE